MRVALLQIRLLPEGVAHNIQVIVGAVDRAANANPPPDLLILPGASDTGGSASAIGRASAVLDGTRAAIVSKAREWGVFIAAGLGVMRDGSFHSTAVLFDPDGDALIRTCSYEDNDRGDDGGRLRLFPTSIGLIGLLDYNDIATFSWAAGAIDREALMIVPRRGSYTDGRYRSGGKDVKVAMCDLALQSGLYWCVVSPTSPSGSGTTDSGVGSLVCGPSGKLLAAVDQSEEEIVQVDVPIAPARLSESAGRSGEQDRAD